ncbi:Cysteine-rich secretory protein family protein [Chitinophaga rupis]|uniref:Cysteine-rich secretory protein family protein n=1 Tax=Chitinophaga rupis TaxID=573321 RepID=A0A1H8FNR9_9BACT|nr:CAP domain-containing protein [Chitinophaga rupis]SEN32738.1 Cysteine-rich secretory protein family protein [Chitinophaga rupis]
MVISKQRKIVLLFLSFFLSMQAWACHRGTVAADSSVAAKSMDEQILYYTNKFRESKGLAPLQLVSTISKEAEDHSQDMAKGRTGFGHEGFEERVDHVGKKLGRVAAAAENVAYGNLDAEGVVNGWIKSPGHRRNMLGDYNLIGIGSAQGKGNIIFFTQVFIKH